MALAPIGISTYSRINHLKQTIEALQNNSLAKDSEIYIFSDAPQKGDEEKTAKVREYIHSVDGFKKVYIVEREVNGRVANNRGGIKQLLDEHGKMIWLEEDIVTASGFLTFMNYALDFYEDDENVLSITGYSPPFTNIEDYPEDVFILQRFSAWGFASWRNKFNPFKFGLNEHGIEDFLKNKKEIKEFKKNGEDMYPMLTAEYEGRIDALDVKLMYFEYKYGMYTLFPYKSLVQNIGHDGSGVHCGISDKFLHSKLWDKTDNFKFVKDIKVDKTILKANSKFRKLGLKHNIVNCLKFFRLYYIVKKVVNIFR